jgi:serine O-acetyltransferase
MTIWEQLREDFDANGRTVTKPGWHALIVHRFGAAWTRLPIPLRLPLMLLYRLAFWFVRNVYGIELFYTTEVGRRLSLPHGGAIVIHPYTVIGDDCLIRQNVTIGAAVGSESHEAPKLGNRVSVGAGAAVLGKIQVGDDVRIGPNAVVMMNVPAGATVATPAPRIVTPPVERRAEPVRSSAYASENI